MELTDRSSIEWLVNREPGSQPDLLCDVLRSVPLPQGRVAGWAACEFSSMRSLRAFLREELGLRGPSGAGKSTFLYAIAGLIEDSFLDSAAQLPWLGDVPVLLQSQKDALDKAKVLLEKSTDEKTSNFIKAIIQHMETSVNKLTEAQGQPKAINKPEKDTP